ncbi:MAG: OmpA family protein [Chromatiales bacterium]|jgi:outer membrane protein OmpA-like peptidoglycan-associated protein
MPSDNIPTQNNLLGENDSIWGILALLLVGIITSITTVQLLLPQGMTMETFRAWLSPAEYPAHSPRPPIPAISSINVVPGSDDVSIPDLPPLGYKDEIGHDDTETSVDGSLPAKVSVSGDLATAQSNTGLGKSHSARVTQSARSHLSQTASKAGQASAAHAEFAANETFASSDLAGAEPADSLDCAPLFIVRFLYDGIQPLDSDLAEKGRRLRAWLDLHPQAELLVEGHADASGPDEYNLFISHRRAKVVYNLLADAGIAKERMAIRALGEYSPLAGLPPESAKNRCVTLRIEGVRACSNLLNDGNN